MLWKKELSHPHGWEQAPRALAPLLWKGLATLENFPALSNGVGVLFLLGPLRCLIRKLPQTLKQAVPPLFGYKILRRDWLLQFQVTSCILMSWVGGRVEKNGGGALNRKGKVKTHCVHTVYEVLKTSSLPITLWGCDSSHFTEKWTKNAEQWSPKVKKQLEGSWHLPLTCPGPIQIHF